MLENRTSSRSFTYFVAIYWLLYAEENEETLFNEDPFANFDSGFESLLNRVEDFLGVN